MGADPLRRARVGRSMRRRAGHLGGVFPWIADLLADLPALAGPAIAEGLKDGRRTNALTAFVDLDPASDGSSVLRRNVDASLLSIDLGLLGTVVKLLRPFTGSLSSKLVDSVLAVVVEQIGAESDLDLEVTLRAKVQRLSGLHVTSLKATPAGLVEEQDGTDTREPAIDVVDLRTLVAAWTQGAVDGGLLLPSVNWRTALISADQVVVIRCIAGAVEASEAHRNLVACLARSGRVDAREQLCKAVAAELGGDPHHASVGNVADTLASFVDPARTPPRFGPLGLLREVDAAARSSEAAAELTRGFFLIARQLTQFRAMADQLGDLVPLFDISEA